MITCQHARQLFDRYLDGELSASLQAELHAHVLQCAPCQNSLSLLEACGDVIRLDACEPALSGSFTDRFLSSWRQQQAPIPLRGVGSRGWRRAGWWIGAPLAAAASLVLIATVGVPVFEGRVFQQDTVTAGAQVAAPAEFQKNLISITGTRLDPEAARELQDTPQMKALPFLEALVNPVVEGTRHAVEGTRRGYEDIELLIRFGFAGMNKRLVAEYREKYPEVPPQAAERVISDLDILPSPISPELPDQEASSAEPAPLRPAPAASPDAI